MEIKSNYSICILNNTLNPGGAEKNCVIICNELVKRGVDVELWITRLGKTSLIKLLDNRVRVCIIPGKRVRYTLLHLKDLMLNCKSKTLLVFNMELLIPAVFINSIYHLNLRIVARSISTLSLAYNQQSYIGRRIWFRLIRHTINRIDSIIAQSSGMKEDLIKNFNMAESKIKIIPNPVYNFINTTINPAIEVNNDTYNSSEPLDYGINLNELLFVGRLTEDKGLNYLLDIFSIVLTQIPELHLTIVGQGELRNMVQAKIAAMGLTKNISLAGYQADVSTFYKNARATILTSVREGFPNVLIESISFGTPIISFDCPSGPRDIIINNVNGILIEHLNVVEFANAIIDVINGNIKFEKQEIIKSSYRYNVESIINQYEKLLFG